MFARSSPKLENFPSRLEGSLRLSVRTLEISQNDTLLNVRSLQATNRFLVSVLPSSTTCSLRVTYSRILSFFLASGWPWGSRPYCPLALLRLQGQDRSGAWPPSSFSGSKTGVKGHKKSKVVTILETGIDFLFLGHLGALDQAPQRPPMTFSEEKNLTIKSSQSPSPLILHTKPNRTASLL